MNFYYFIKNLLNKNYNLIPHSRFKFYIKLLLHIFFNRNLRNHRLKAITKFYIPKEVEFNSGSKKELFLIAGDNGLYLKNSENEFFNILKNVGGMFGLDYYKDTYYAACHGSAHTKGCLYSFKIKNNKVYDFKIIFKKRFQYFHGLKIHDDHLYLSDSSWLVNHCIIHKFKINEHGVKKVSSNNIDVSTQRDFNQFCHVNSISFYNDKLYLLFHNMTEYSKINSAIIVFDKNFKFSKKFEFQKGLNSAHDFSISSKGKSILDSNNSILYFNDLKIKLEGYFIRGYLEENNKIYIGLNKKKSNKNLNEKNFAGIAEVQVSADRLNLIRTIKTPVNSINSILKVNIN
ncbi:hypothetical protein OAA01_01380 [Pelagibacteraceae bacterium]|nr:hypothetical protein [Pelagibacteraceae bacterium]